MASTVNYLKFKQTNEIEAATIRLIIYFQLPQSSQPAWIAVF